MTEEIFPRTSEETCEKCSITILYGGQGPKLCGACYTEQTPYIDPNTLRVYKITPQWGLGGVSFIAKNESELIEKIKEAMKHTPVEIVEIKKVYAEEVDNNV